jgi:hypothetical protein
MGTDPLVSLKPQRLIRTVSLRPWNLNFAKEYLVYLGEYEAICKTALIHDSVPQRGLFDFKKREYKMLWHKFIITVHL